MSITGLNILTPFIADDELYSSSSLSTSYFEIDKLNFVSNSDSLSPSSGYTGYTATFNYSIYSDSDKTYDALNYDYTGLTSLLTFQISLEDYINADNYSGQTIQNAYNIVINYFDENGIDYAIIGPSHGHSDWYCFVSDTVTYSIIDYGTTTIKDSLGTTMVTATGPQRGTFSATTGRYYYGSNPVGLICEGSQSSIVPKSLNGHYFQWYCSRNTPTTYYIYSPFGKAHIDFYGTGTTGINSDIVKYIIIESGHTSFEYSPYGYTVFKSDIPIACTARQNSADEEILCPSDYYIYKRRSQYNKTVYNTTPSNVGSHYTYDDSLCMNVAIADGAGLNCEQGIGISYMNNVYSFGNVLSDYAIINPYTGNTISVDYYSDSIWSQLNYVELTDSTFTNPGYFFSGETISGTGDDLAGGANLWRFMGKYPFALVINDSSADECILYGWNQDINNIVLTNNLIFSLDADEYGGSGTSVIDTIQDNNGTMQRADIGTTESDVFTFVSGSTDYINMSNNLISTTPSITHILTGDTSYTLEAWIYLNTTPTGVGNSAFGIVGHRGANGVGLQIEGPDRNVNFGYRSTGNIDSTTNLELHRWYHVVGSRRANDATKNRIYINGVESGTHATYNSVNDTTYDLQIGYAQDRIGAFDGKIAVVRVYNVGLTAEEVKQNYESEKIRFL